MKVKDIIDAREAISNSYYSHTDMMRMQYALELYGQAKLAEKRIKRIRCDGLDNPDFDRIFDDALASRSAYIDELKHLLAINSSVAGKIRHVTGIDIMSVIPRKNNTDPYLYSFA